MPLKQDLTTPAIWFELKLVTQGVPVGYFTEASGLSAEIETMTYNEGGRNDSVHKLPTRMKHPNLVLKRGVTSTSALQKWVDDSWMGPTREDITLTMYNEALEKMQIWSFKGAYPVKWTGPTFNTAQTTIATEVIELVHDGIKVN